MVLQQLVQVYDSSEFTDRQCHESTLFCILTSQKQDLTEKKISLAGHCVWPPFKNKIILSLVTVILPGKVLLGQSFVGLVSQHEEPQTLWAALCYRSHVRVKGSITA